MDTRNIRGITGVLLAFREREKGAIMSETVESAIAWRLLATLEGGSLLLITSALLAYTARNKILKKIKPRNPVNSVLITNIETTLGKELKREFEEHGCVVRTIASDATSEAETGKVDALIVVGTNQTGDSLNAMADVVTRDVYDNLKLLESMVPLVKRGGYVAWACAGATRGAFSGASIAFDAVLEASLRQVANSSHCEPIWLGRQENTQLVVEKCVRMLLTCTIQHDISIYYMRNIARRISKYVGKCLKTITLNLFS